MDDDALIERVRQRAIADGTPPAAPASAEEVAAAEAALGLALPPLLIRLYREVGDGGYGPDRFLLWPLSRITASYPRGAGWPAGVLPVLDWGCGMSGAVDCLRPGAPVLLHEPNAERDDPAQTWFEDSPSLSQWLADWLDGRAWWEEHVMEEQDYEMLPAWPDAAARIASSG
ncbi:SMI1/KNR4 family protein [Kitasatospora aureofaciens]|uniref:SMI1/KNR4 family protein n=1 Tax=Kitasatospora aureofaciens TaxID=1894 RepID=UPI001C46ED50|nr:SMI1/KNR4 family protein [Kitasatospora aureofaciens]MBV6698964.1 SMI1/KNR4 family protein [Kitasatospora aureofaciens]